MNENQNIILLLGDINGQQKMLISQFAVHTATVEKRLTVMETRVGTLEDTVLSLHGNVGLILRGFATIGTLITGIVVLLGGGWLLQVLRIK